MLMNLPKFKTYTILVSENAAYFIPEEHILESLEKHRQMDFGLLNCDYQENEEAIKTQKGFVLSCYDFITPPLEESIEYHIYTSFDEGITKIYLVYPDANWFGFDIEKETGKFIVYKKGRCQAIFDAI